MGIDVAQEKLLFPEEALFLIESNLLSLTVNGVSLSVQEAFQLLLSPENGLTKEEYMVYAHLRRLGYIVVRHGGR